MRLSVTTLSARTLVIEDDPGDGRLFRLSLSGLPGRPRQEIRLDHGDASALADGILAEPPRGRVRTPGGGQVGISGVPAAGAAELLIAGEGQRGIRPRCERVPLIPARNLAARLREELAARQGRDGKDGT